MIKNNQLVAYAKDLDKQLSSLDVTGHVNLLNKEIRRIEVENKRLEPGLTSDRSIEYKTWVSEVLSINRNRLIYLNNLLIRLN